MGPSQEAINKKIKENTVQKYQYESVEQLKEHLYYYILDYNYDRKLKALNFKTPYEMIIEKHQRLPESFKQNPVNKFLGRNTYYGVVEPDSGMVLGFRGKVWNKSPGF